MEINGLLNGEDIKVGIVGARFNDFITNKLFEGAMDCLIRHGVLESDVDLVRVPGAFEIPFIADKMASSKT